jgi:hypothetical protein
MSKYTEKSPVSDSSRQIFQQDGIVIEYSEEIENVF